MQDAQHEYAAAKREMKAAADQARAEGRQGLADDLELLLYERGRSERHVTQRQPLSDPHALTSSSSPSRLLIARGQLSRCRDS